MKKIYACHPLRNACKSGIFRLASVLSFTLFPLLAMTQSAGNYAGLPNGNFTAVSGTFTSIATTGTTVTYAPSSSYDPKDEGGTNPVPIGFDFTLFGTKYSYCTIYANGYLSFAATPDLGTFHGTFANANTANSHPIIAPYWADVEAQNNAVFIQTSGTAPNRVFTVEWPNMGIWKYSPPASYAMQVKLYEANGMIELVYDDLPGAQVIASSIGLSNSTTNFVGLNNTSSTPTPSTSTAVTTAAGKPAAGQIYRFTPPPANTGSGLVFGTFTNVQSNQLTLNWTHAVPASTTFYKIQRAVFPFTDFVTVGTVPLGVFTYTNTGLTPNTQYQYRVVAANEGFEDLLNASAAPLQSTLPCGAIAGNISIGPGGGYTTLTAALAELQLKGATGNVTFELQSTYNGSGETYPIDLIDIRTHVCSSPNATITIRPETGASGLELSSGSAVATLQLNGADYYTIDGRPGGTGTARELTISNSNTAAPAVRILNDAIGNTVRWCNIRSGNLTTTSGSLLIGASTGTRGNDSNTISNCYFSSIPGQSAVNALTSIGQSTSVQNNNNNITGNLFNNFGLTGVNISGTGNGSNWNITANSFYDTAVSTGTNTWTGISFSTAAGSNSVNNNISLNYIGGTAAQCGGAPMVSARNLTTPVYTGILYSSTNGSVNTIYGNMIRNIVLSNATDSASFRGIAVTLGAVNIDSNIIGDNNPANYYSILSFANSAIEGINTTSTAGISITRNVISGLRNTTAGATGAVRGIFAAGTGALTISNNTVKNLSSNSPNVGATVSATVVGIVSSSSSNTILISNNTIGGGYNEPLKSANTTVTAVKTAGIISTAGLATIQNNVISGILVDSSTQNSGTTATLAVINGILNSSSVAGQVIQNNQINSLKSTSPTTLLTQTNGIAVTGTGATSISGNIIYGLWTKSGFTSSGVSACLTAINASGSGTYTISDNYIDSVAVGTATAAGTYLYGIVLNGATGNAITNNTIRNLYSFSSATAVGATAGINHATGVLNSVIEGNKITNIVARHATASNILVGIMFAGSTTVAGNNSMISRNTIHSLKITSTSASATTTGIHVASGICNMVNNMIRVGIDSAGTALTTGNIYYGIHCASTSAGPIRVYNNTVYCGGAPATGTAITNAFYVASTTPVIDVKNNIFYVDSSGIATGARYAMRFAGMANVTSNYNLLYSPKPTTGYLVGVTTPAATYTTLSGLTGWKFVGRQDIQSGEGSPNFVNATGSHTQVDLRIQSPTLIEGVGTSALAISVTNDIDNNTRSALSPVDVGAHSGNFTLLVDTFAPEITYQPLTNTNSTVNRSLTVSITDPYGIYTEIASGLQPVLYYRKGLTGSFNQATGTLVSGNSRNGQWSFTLDYTLSGGVLTGDTVFYYVVAQDSSNNLSSNPANAIGTTVTTVSTAPSLMNSYKIVGGIPTYVTVGSTGTYTSLTGANGLFNAINNNMLQGNTVVDLEPGTIAETGAVQLNQWLETNGVNVANYGYTLTIQPQGTSKSVLEGSAATGLITLNGADRVRFRGMPAAGTATDTFLVIRSTSTNTALMLQNDASSNSFQNVIFEGLGNVFNNSATSLVTGNDNISIDRCVFRSATLPTLASTLLISTGTAERENDTLLISNCNFYNFTANGVSIGANHGDMVRIRNNSFYNELPLTANTVAINFLPGAVSDNDTIMNNYIGGSLPLTQGTALSNTLAFTGIAQSVGSGTGVYCAGNLIRNINQVAGTTGVFTGISVAAGSGMITGNTIGDSVGTSITSALNSLMTGIASTTPASMVITGNIITNISNSNTGTGARIIGVSATSNTNSLQINNNLVQNFTAVSTNAGTTTSALMIGISNTSNPGSLTIQNNTIRNFINNSNTSSYQITGIYNSTGPVMLSGNLVENLSSYSTSTSTSTSCALSGIINASAITGLQVTNNTVRKLFHYRDVPVASQMIGILSSGSAATAQITGNMVYSLTTNSNSATAAGATCALIGLSYVGTGGSNMTFSRNTVYAIKDTCAAGNINIIGIYYSGSTSGTNQVTKNFVHSFGLSTSGTGSMTGIFYNAGLSIIANNMVRVGIDSAGTLFTGPYNVFGIHSASAGLNNFFHNSIYVGGQPASGAGMTAALHLAASANGDAARQDSRNNIFVNAVSNNGSSGVNHAVRLNYQRSYVGNNNIYYAPGTGGLLIGTALTTVALPISTFPSLRGALGWNYYTEKDIYSGVGDPGFLNPTGSAANVDLRLNPANPCESSGDSSLLTLVPDDFDGNARSGFSPPDIGASAGNYTLTPDLFPPVISYATLGNSGNLTGPYQLASVRITDKVGVQLTGPNAPRLYYQKGSAGAWQSVPASSYTGTGTDALFNFNIDYALVGGVATGNVIYYYVIAQDSLGANVLTNPVYSVATSVNNVTSPTFSPNFYNLLPSIPAGSKFYVGTGQQFTSLTGAGGLFAYLNTYTINGNITAVITSDLNETGANQLGAIGQQGIGAGTFTVTIRPDSSATVDRVVSGSALNGLIVLNGADNIKFTGVPDGSSDNTLRLLRFRNNNTGPTISFTNDATGNAIRNCAIEGINTATGVVFFGTTAFNEGNSNDTISNCLLHNNTTFVLPAGVPTNLIHCASGSIAQNSGIVITGNSFYNFGRSGINADAGGGTGWVITGNSFFNNLSTPPSTVEVVCIRMNATVLSGGHTISNNYMGGQAINAGGAAWQHSIPFNWTGILLNGNAAGSTVSGNVIRNLNLSGISANSFTGIATGSHTIATISGNTIGDPLLTNSIMINYAATHSGINIVSMTVPGNITINNNNIHGISIDNASGAAAFQGIGIAGGIPVVSNNTIGHASTANSITLNGTGVLTGINSSLVNTQNATLMISGNTIGNLSSVGNNTTTGVSGIVHSGTAAPEITGNTISALSSSSQNTVTTGIHTASGIAYVSTTAGSTAGGTIVNNTISNISATATGALATNASGIVAGGAGVNLPVIARNRIYDIINLSSLTLVNPAATANGISAGSAVSSMLIHNNRIALGINQNNNIQYNGIWQTTSGSFSINSYYNSVVIGGSNTAGSVPSYAYHRGNNVLSEITSTVKLVNNALVNTRTGGSAKNYAVANEAAGTVAGTGWPVAASNYNFFSAASGNIGLWGTADRSFSTWQTSSSSDASSWSASSTAIDVNNLFTNPATADLSVRTNNPEAWYLNGKGVAGLTSGYTLIDYSNGARDTTTGFGTDIGSDEFTATSLPIVADTSGAITAGSTTNFTFAGRVVASILWTSTAVSFPSNVTLRYYTGNDPTGPAPSSRYYNGYWSVQFTGGANYNYDMSLNYDAALLGTIATETDAVMAHKLPANPWNYNVSTILNTGSKNAASGTFGYYTATANANFTLTDINAPLPVTITAFTARTSENKHVVLNWSTAVESNNRGFEVERSADGHTFRYAGFIAGAGNSRVTRQYGMTDADAFEREGTTVLYYRLKQVDLNGTNTYSGVVAAYSLKIHDVFVTAQPNPSAGVFGLNVVSPNASGVQIDIYNLQGKLVYSGAEQASAGVNLFKLNALENNPDGIYFVKVTMENATRVVRVIKSEQ